MTDSELILYLKLKYFPIQPTESYFNQFPTPVLAKVAAPFLFVQKNGTLLPEREWYIQTTVQVLRFLDPQNSRFSNRLLLSLWEYYTENHGELPQ